MYLPRYISAFSKVYFQTYDYLETIWVRSMIANVSTSKITRCGPGSADSHHTASG